MLTDSTNVLVRGGMATNVRDGSKATVPHPNSERPISVLAHRLESVTGWEPKLQSKKDSFFITIVL